jgi:hypothetical protein
MSTFPSLIVKDAERHESRRGFSLFEHPALTPSVTQVFVIYTEENLSISRIERNLYASPYRRSPRLSQGRS